MATLSLSTAANGNIESIKRHELYYIPTADLCVLVEHVQFRIHRYFLERESTYFMRELAPTNKILSPSPLSGLPGSTESASIILDKLTADQFAQFLWVFYNPIYSPYDADVPTWSTILSLATRWEFPNIHDLCVRELEKLPMTDVQRIKLYQENRVDRNVLIPRYAALCQRPEPLTMEEGMELGMQTFAMIAAGRERVRWNARLPNGAMSPVSPPVDAKTEEIEEVVRTLFAIPPPQSSGAGAAATSSGALQSTATGTPKSTSTAPPRPLQTTQPATAKQPPAPLQVNIAKQEDKPAPAAASNKPTAQTPSTPLTGKKNKQQAAKVKETIPQTPQTPTKAAGPQPWPTPTKENSNSKTKGTTKTTTEGKGAANESPKQKDKQQESVKDDSAAASGALASSNDKTLPDVPASDLPVDSTTTPAPAPVDSSSASTTVDPAAANPPADSSTDSSKPTDTIDTTTTSTSTDPAPTNDANANTNPPNDTTTPTITADTNPIVPIPTDSNTTAAATTLISDDLSKLDDKTLDPTSATVQIDLLGDATGADPIGAVANVITGTGERDWSGIFGTNGQSTAASETQAERGEDAAGVNVTKLFDFSGGWDS
ncbi:hypothetical protein D9613_001055 [Agrocybe pediades]|uniref:BTB domain-containing protein n=1 Tax=Agrocybe pediades TaxID=84607 RepID=A0A8H4R037_9AGAR|nr:hypothetical protein D9613_001055 [Agrocybe pediades]